MPLKIAFFGSTNDSVLVLNTLFESIQNQTLKNFEIIAIVTKPPKPVGRTQTLTPTPISVFAKSHGITCMEFADDSQKPWLYLDENQVINSISSLKPDILISASYGQKIPSKVIENTKYGGINIHPSLLPHWRGTDPIPWTILEGLPQTGVTLVTITDVFDSGNIVDMKKIMLKGDEKPDTLRTELFIQGSQLLVESLPKITSHEQYQHAESTILNQSPSYARRLTRDDGFVPWEILIESVKKSPFNPSSLANIPIIQSLKKQKAEIDNSVHPGIFIDRMVRALSPWPGVWSLAKLENVTGDKRIKILETHMLHDQFIIDTIQLEGKNPVSWDQFCSSYEIIE